jgi:hypothetical protein
MTPSRGCSPGGMASRTSASRKPTDAPLQDAQAGDGPSDHDCGILVGDGRHQVGHARKTRWALRGRAERLPRRPRMRSSVAPTVTVTVWPSRSPAARHGDGDNEAERPRVAGERSRSPAVGQAARSAGVALWAVSQSVAPCASLRRSTGRRRRMPRCAVRRHLGRLHQREGSCNAAGRMMASTNTGGGPHRLGDPLAGTLLRPNDR